MDGTSASAADRKLFQISEITTARLRTFAFLVGYKQAVLDFIGGWLHFNLLAFSNASALSRISSSRKNTASQPGLWWAAAR